MAGNYFGTIKIGSATLEEIIREGMIKRGMLTEDSSTQCTTFFYRNVFGNQAEVKVNQVIVHFGRSQREID